MFFPAKPLKFAPADLTGPDERANPRVQSERSCHRELHADPACLPSSGRPFRSGRRHLQGAR